MKSEEAYLSNHSAKFLLILILSLAIGGYLLFSTEVISKDSVCYIAYAKLLQTNALSAIKNCSEAAPVSYTPGYPFLILCFHDFFNTFFNVDSAQGWAISAQSVSLFFKVLAFVPIYLIGRKFTSSNKCIICLLVLAFLPSPAKIGSDALRDWPHMFFLAFGFWFLITGFEKRRWQYFAMAGVITALGYIIRPMCVQILFYACIWLIKIVLQKLKSHDIKINLLNPVKFVCITFAGFFIIAGPYMFIRGEVIPYIPATFYQRLKSHFQNENVKNQIHTQNFLSNSAVEDSNLKKNKDRKDYSSQISSTIKTFAIALWSILEDIAANVHYVFLVPIIVGIIDFYKRSKKCDSRFILTVLLISNLILLTARFFLDTASTKRYTMPMSILLLIFMPRGLAIISIELRKLIGRVITLRNPAKTATQYFFMFFLIAGICSCIPKLLEPIGNDKLGYKLAGEWLKENTNENEVIAAVDKRILYYAQRTGDIIPESIVPEGYKYFVQKVRINQTTSLLNKKEIWAEYLNSRKTYKVVIY